MYEGKILKCIEFKYSEIMLHHYSSRFDKRKYYVYICHAFLIHKAFCTHGWCISSVSTYIHVQ